MALSIVFKQVMQQLPLKYASGSPEADDTLRAMLALSETSRAMRYELHAAVNLRVLRNERALHNERVWDAYVAGLEHIKHPPHYVDKVTFIRVPFKCAGVDWYGEWMYTYHELVDDFILDRLEDQFPYAKPRVSWIMRTFKSVRGVFTALARFGHCPMECRENGTVVVKPFADVTLDDEWCWWNTSVSDVYFVPVNWNDDCGWVEDTFRELFRGTYVHYMCP